MTARDKICRLYRQYLVLGRSGLGMAIGSVAVATLLMTVLPDELLPRTGLGRKDFWMIALMLGGCAGGFVVGLTGFVRLFLGSRCPWCRGN